MENFNQRLGSWSVRKNTRGSQLFWKGEAVTRCDEGFFCQVTHGTERQGLPVGGDSLKVATTPELSQFQTLFLDQ